MSPTLVFFRNDDVNRMEPGLVETTAVLNRHGIPVSHAVEPANLTGETKDWLLSLPRDRVEIIQHGYAHVRHDRGEFGGSRSAEDQARDLAAGLAVMEEAFGDRFFRAMSFPFGSYNRHSVPLLDSLGYEVVSCHRRHQRSRQLFYAAGRALGRGRLMGRHVSHHLGRYPGTGVREISVTIAPIARYLEEAGPTCCEFHPLPYLQAAYAASRAQSRVVGVVLHHRYRATDDALRRLDEFAGWLAAARDVEFATLEGICRRLDNEER